MGQRDMFTSSDVEKLNKMYKCGNIPFEETTDSSEVDDKIDITEGTTNRPSGGSGSGNGSGNNFPVLNFLGNLVGAAIAASGKK